jgi:hypothetical protein
LGIFYIGIIKLEKTASSNLYAELSEAEKIEFCTVHLLSISPYLLQSNSGTSWYCDCFKVGRLNPGPLLKGLFPLLARVDILTNRKAL